jgi:hypothetical protein
VSASGGVQLGQAEYAELVARVQATVASVVPPGSSVLVVSRGDTSLLSLPGSTAAHFPQDEAGEYAGHHPRDSSAAIAALEELRRRGAEYLVIPTTARWWLDYYSELATHLATHGELVADEPDTCFVYALGTFAGGAAQKAPDTSIDQMRGFLEHLLSGDSRLVVLEEDPGATAERLGPLRAVGVPVGGSPANAESVLAELHRQATRGADYLIVPRRLDDWFDRASGVGARVEAGCRKIADQRHLCRIFELADMRGLQR